MVRAGGGEQAAHRLVAVFVGEFERRVMDGEQASTRGGREHLPDLLGRGVLVLPRVVGADAKKGEINRTDAAEGVGACGVACGDGSTVVRDDDVGVEAAAEVEPGASAPVGGADGSDGKVLDFAFVVPVEFDDVAEAARDQAAGAACGDDGGARRGERGEGRTVEVVVVGVGDEDRVGRWKRRGIDGARTAGGAERERAEARADTT